MCRVHLCASRSAALRALSSSLSFKDRKSTSSSSAASLPGRLLPLRSLPASGAGAPCPDTCSVTCIALTCLHARCKHVRSARGTASQQQGEARRDLGALGHGWLAIATGLLETCQARTHLLSRGRAAALRASAKPESTRRTLPAPLPANKPVASAAGAAGRNALSSRGATARTRLPDGVASTDVFASTDMDTLPDTGVAGV